MGSPLIVLVHGAWLGGWSWQPVRTALRGYGLDTHAPTLTALGDRAHLGGAESGLHAHVADLLESLKFADRKEVALVGHSYGAVVAAQAAAKRPDIVRWLITLDGFTLRQGQSIFSRHPELADLFGTWAAPDQPGFVQPPSREFLGLPDSADTQRLMEKLRPMPVRAFSEPAEADAPSTGCERHYVRFSGFPFFEATAHLAHADGWQVSEIDAGHMAITTDPERVAARIHAIIHGE